MLLIFLGLAAVVTVAAHLDPGSTTAPPDGGMLSTSAADVRCFTCTEQACRTDEVAPCRPDLIEGDQAHFTSGEIDLTGDGTPETVRLTGSQVVVEQGGDEAWRSPPHWDVVDVALGDPNDDGRGEILLAFWREDDEGIPGSHPFIVGHRKGRYRTLWGGSAVVDPIFELALGDVDGDRVQELVVLESDGTESAIAVWQWHGWGFTLVWRSTTGVYRDLVVLPGKEGTPDTIRVLSGGQP
ncbi:MAG: hypothetical protein ACP5JG_10295 [Anaerolineae bacterium]